MPSTRKTGIVSLFDVSSGWRTEHAISGTFAISTPNIYSPIEQARAGSIVSTPLTISGTIAPWLSDVQRRIAASVAFDEPGGARGGERLSSGVVTAANSFFEATSSLFPNEPYIYGSHDGDLIAEFGNSAGRMTVVVTKDAALTFAVVGNQNFLKTIPLTAAKPDMLRREVAEITERFRMDSHGTLGAKP